MRLLLVIAELRHGGAERIVVELAADASRRGDAVMVASGGGPWVKRVLAVGAGHAVVPLQRRSALDTLTAARRLAAVIRRFRPDVIHAHNVRAALGTGLALARPGRHPALLTTLHGLAPGDYANAARLLRLTGGTVVACAPSVGRALADAGFPISRLDVVTNGVAVQAPAERDLEAVRRRFGIGGRPLVVGIGRLVEQKAWPTLIEAAPRIGDADVLVAGDGPLREELRAAAANAGGRVRFLGAVEQPAALICLARCVVATSTWEGLPLALLEALTLGAPVVATRVGGIADLIPPDAALLVEPDDPAGTAAAVNRVLSDADLDARLSRAARAASHAWSLDAMLAGYRQRYAARLSDRS
jgi:glycosyltransferase involved in cell wall biosynthesis